MLKKAALCASVSAAILCAQPSFAEDQMSMEDIQTQLRQLSTQVQHLSTVVEEQNETIKRQEAEIKQQRQVSSQLSSSIQPAAGKDNNEVKITMNPSPKFESADGRFSFQPHGRAHFDVTAFDDDKHDHASNANVRRARIGFKGKIGHDLDYKTDIDFGEEGVAFKDVYLNYTGLDAADIRIGHQKPSFGMEKGTSSNYLLFIERTAPTNAFTRNEEIGLNVLAGGDSWSLDAGVFNEDGGNDDTGEDEDITFDARGSVNALALYDPEAEHVLHLGAGISHRRPTGNVRFRAKPAGDGDNVIDTGNLSAVDTVNVYNAELAAVVGPVTFQGEYFNTDVSRSGGNSDADLDGYYAQVGWFVTGESRPYKASKGNFGRVKPNTPFSLSNGGWGAWEVLVRYENADLNDESAGVTGGEASNYGIGVNWHLTDRVRFMANVLDIDTDNNAVVANDDPTVYNFRAQWDF